MQLEPDLSGRVEILELELQIGLREGWLRFWHRGELLDLPAELQQRLDQLSQQNQKQLEELQLKSEQLSQQSHELQLNRSSSANSRGTSTIWSKAWLTCCIGCDELAEARARQVNRPDILEQIPRADFAQLEQWLREL